MSALWTRFFGRNKEPLLFRLFASWSFSSLVGFLLAGKSLYDLSAFRAEGLLLFVCSFAAAFCLFSLASAFLLKKREGFPADAVFLFVSFGAYSFLTCLSARDFYYALALSALWAVFLWYCRKRGMLTIRWDLSKRGLSVFVAVLSAVFLLLVGGVGVLRVLTLRAPNYDFGVFVQSFEGLRRTLVPINTVERDGLLSHFAVHFSPIFDLFLPVYALSPSPLTLQLGQAAALMSAAIPLVLLCRQKNVSRGKTAALAFVALFAPAVYMGTNYDFHENCFLLPLLLWIFWAYEKDAVWRMFLFGALTLTVKEDAFIYLAFFGLYVLFDRKKYARGLILILGSFAYFIFACLWLASAGQGVMTGRYGNFLVGDEGLMQAVKTVLTDPGFALTQIFKDDTGAAGKKLAFLVQVFLPLGCLPFAVRHPKRLLLLFPMLLMNLLTVYPYQYDVGFQYAFGSFAFLMYLSVLNVGDAPEKTGLPLCLGCVLTLLASAALLLPTARDYLTLRRETRGQCGLITEALAGIPEEDGVTASTMLIPPLCGREELYEVYYHKLTPDTLTPWAVIDCRYDYEQPLSLYKAWGYTVEKEVYDGDTPLIVILKRPD